MDLFRRATDLVRPSRSAKSLPARSTPGQTWRRLGIEQLEDRRLLAATTAPFYFVDNVVGTTSGGLAFQPSQINMAIYSKDFQTNPASENWYYYDAAGNPHSTVGLATVPVFQMNDLIQISPVVWKINLPLQMPGNSYGPNSARVYMTMDAPIDLTINADGSVNALTPNYSFYDFVEFSLNAPMSTPQPGNLGINTSNIDQFGFPIKVTVESADAPADGVGIAMTRDSVISQFQSFTSDAGDPYAQLIYPYSFPPYGTYRIESPDAVFKGSTVANTATQAMTTLQNSVGIGDASVNVYSGGAFPDPSTTEFLIKIDNEIMKVTGPAPPPGNGTVAWMVERGLNGTTPAIHYKTAQVFMPGSGVALLEAINNSQTQFNVQGAGPLPAATPTDTFTVAIDQEQMLVIGSTLNEDGSTTWTVKRAQNGTSPASHAYLAFALVPNYAMSATQTTMTMPNIVGYPPYPFRVRVDQEDILVNSLASVNLDQTTTWNVTRAQDGTTAAPHVEGALVYYNSMTSNPLNTIFNSAIDAFFNKYLNATGSNQLTLYSQADGNQRTYSGTVTQDAVGQPYYLKLTSSQDPHGIDYKIYYPFFTDNRYLWGGYTPQLTPASAPAADIATDVAALSPSDMVFSCSGVFADSANRSEYTDNQQLVLGDLENQFVAALNRGVAMLPGYNATSSTGTWSDTTTYYGNNNQPFNRYAQFMHQVGIDNRAYGFAYDDQHNLASYIGVNSFTSATVLLGPWVQVTTPPLSQRFFLASFVRATPSSLVADSPPPLVLPIVGAAPATTQVPHSTTTSVDTGSSNTNPLDEQPVGSISSAPLSTSLGLSVRGMLTSRLRP